MSSNTDNTRLVTIVLAIIGAVVLLPMLLVGFGMAGFGSMMGGMWGGGPTMGWMTLVGVVMQVLFLAAIVGAGYFVYRAVAGSESASDQATEEARLAYARGELTDEEYEQRRETFERDTRSRGRRSGN